jgi:ABC-2 type transport system ATP-binding protein
VDAIIQVERVVKRFATRRPQKAITAIDGVSFQVRRGEILGLLGPNGAGKTTTIKTICGLLLPDEGRVLVNGLDNQRQRLAALRHISAVLEGNRNLYWRLTVRENLEYFAGNRGRSRRSCRAQIDALLEQFRLHDKANEPVSSLSRGMQQKLAIAVAMLADTDVILLDEPTLGLDVAAGYEVRELLRQIAAAGRTVVISTHDMQVVQDVCERTVIINAGRVVVDDRVSRLLALFETRAYVVTLGCRLTPEQTARLKLRFPLSAYTAGDRPTIDVALEHGADFYELIEILKQERTPVEAIDRTAISFERVFLAVVRGPGGPLAAEPTPEGVDLVVA